MITVTINFRSCFCPRQISLVAGRKANAVYVPTGTFREVIFLVVSK